MEQETSGNRLVIAAQIKTAAKNGGRSGIFHRARRSKTSLAGLAVTYSSKP
jgi:hypothetical protein